MFDLLQKDVVTAHRKFDVPINMIPIAPDPETAIRYEGAISEQAIDLARSLRKGEITEIAERGTNLIYLALSMLVAAGVDAWPFLAEIAQENIERGVPNETISPHVWIASAGHQLMTAPQLVKHQRRVGTERVYKLHEEAADWVVEELKEAKEHGVKGILVVCNSLTMTRYAFTALMSALEKLPMGYRGDTMRYRIVANDVVVQFHQVGDPHRLAGQEYQRAWLVARYLWSGQLEREYIDRLLAMFRAPNCKVVESIG